MPDLSWLSQFPGGFGIPRCEYCNKELVVDVTYSPKHDLIDSALVYLPQDDKGNLRHQEYSCPDHGVVISVRKSWKEGHRQGPGACGVCKLPVCLEWLETFHLIDRITLQPTEHSQGKL